jgi:hypothetical protein
MTVVGGKTTLAIERPSGGTVYAYGARIRCWACKMDVPFFSTRVVALQEKRA